MNVFTRYVGLAATCALALVACKKGNKDGAGAAASASASAGAAASAAGAVESIDAFLKDERAALTPALYEKFLLGLADCNVTDSGIDSNCAGYKAFNKARSRNTALKDIAGLNGSLGQKYIGHTSPAIRLQSAQLMSSIFGSGKGTQEIIVKAATDEKVPAVQRAMINVVGSSVKQSDPVKTLLFTAANSPSDVVRMEALSWLTTSFAAGVPGGFELVLDKVDKDPAIKIRSYLCSRLYGTSDDRAIPVFKKYLTDKAAPKEMVDGCFNGVISAWTGFPLPDKPSQAAYQLTLQVMNTKPRTEDRPPWTGIRTMRAANDAPAATDSFAVKWAEKVKPWYKRETLLKAFEDLALDGKANWIARAGAVENLYDLKAPKATFERMQKALKGKTGTDGMVAKKVDENLAKL